jgi:hypothetical protein
VSEAYIRCLSLTELRRPHIEASERRRCAVCDVEVWLDAALLPEIEAQHPGSDIVIHCRTCPVPMDDGEEADVEFSPGQVRRLRAQGATDEEIAELFALARVAGPSGDLNATRLRLGAARSDSPGARAFRRALEQARVYVALTTDD